MKTTYTFIPIRNISFFSVIVRITFKGEEYLLIPRGLLPTGPFGRADWVNRTPAYFYPLDSYILMSACSSGNVQQSTQRLLTNVNEIIYLVMKHFSNLSLAPHALSNDETIPKENEIQQDAIEINPKLYRRNYEKDNFFRSLYSIIHPKQKIPSLLHLLNRQRTSGENFSIEDVVNELNTKLHLDREEIAHGIAGSILCERFSEVEKKDIYFPGFLSLLRLRNLRHVVLPALGHLRDFWESYRGWKFKPRQIWGRYFWEYGHFDHLPPPVKPFEMNEAPTINNEPIFSIKQKYLLESETEGIKSYLHNFFWAHVNHKTNSREEYWKKLSLHYHAVNFDHLTLNTTGYDSELISYFLEAHGASRPGMKFLQLYNVFEAKMIPPGNERMRLMNYLSNQRLSPSDFDPEFSSLLRYSPPATISGRPSGLSALTYNLNSMVNELYSLRCMIAHSKTGRNRISPFSIEEYDIVPNYLELMRKIAIIAIER